MNSFMLMYTAERGQDCYNGLIRKEKKMFTVIRSSYLNLEIIDDAALKCEECGVSFVYSDKSKLEENTVVRGVRSFG